MRCANGRARRWHAKPDPGRDRPPGTHTRPRSACRSALSSARGSRRSPHAQNHLRPPDPQQRAGQRHQPCRRFGHWCRDQMLRHPRGRRLDHVEAASFERDQARSGSGAVRRVQAAASAGSRWPSGTNRGSATPLARSSHTTATAMPTVMARSLRCVCHLCRPTPASMYGARPGSLSTWARREAHCVPGLGRTGTRRSRPTTPSRVSPEGPTVVSKRTAGSTRWPMSLCAPDMSSRSGIA